jgi:pyruvate dehydrogenase E1 component alpha subunit
MTPEDLLEFEEDIAQEFAAGKIAAPVHLGGGNEQQLINIFARITPEDWVLAGWRSHYHCLLKGVPPAELKAKIMAGHSVSLCFPEQRVLCSGIVGGTASIAVGLAWALAREAKGIWYNTPVVWVFLGDMAAESGAVHEARKYSSRHDLPVMWVVEDNGVSVCTDTRKSWGEYRGYLNEEHYTYELTRPHCGVGRWVPFK